jgi:hypothetical protein
MAYDLVQTNSPGPGVAFVEEQSSGLGAIVQALTFTVNRGATNTQLVGTLPPNARILRIDVTVAVVSNAATTATVSMGVSGGSNTFFSAAQDVKAAIGNFSQTATANWAISTSKQLITCTYTETGAASNAGTFYVAMYYAAL